MFIDEIQHHPDPGKLIKLAVDHRGGEIKLVVSGSSSLQIKGKFASTTVERKVEFLLLPLDFEEFLRFKGREDLAAHLQKIPYEAVAPFLEEYLIFGGYPAVCLASDRETKVMLLSEIFSSLLYKDIIPLFKLKKPEAFSKTFRLLAARTGSSVNLSELAWEAGLSRPALNSYLEALKLTYLIFPLQPFSPNPTTQLRKSQKFYLADSGLRNWAISNFLPLSLRNDTGALAENFVFLEFIKNLPPGAALGYWKRKTGAEVDFVLKGRLPVEVKFSGSSRLLFPKSLISFIEKFSPKKAFVVTKTGKGSRTCKQTEIFYLPIYLSSFIAVEAPSVLL